MSKKVKVILNLRGVYALRLSPEISAVCESVARSKIFDKLPDGQYEVSAPVPARGQRRAHVSVRTATQEAYQDNLRNNTLLKAMGGSGK